MSLRGVRYRSKLTLMLEDCLISTLLAQAALSSLVES